jgi:hypothetical protein
VDRAVPCSMLSLAGDAAFFCIAAGAESDGF